MFTQISWTLLRVYCSRLSNSFSVFYPFWFKYLGRMGCFCWGSFIHEKHQLRFTWEDYSNSFSCFSLQSNQFVKISAKRARVNSFGLRIKPYIQSWNYSVRYSLLSLLRGWHHGLRIWVWQWIWIVTGCCFYPPLIGFTLHWVLWSHVVCLLPFFSPVN